MIEGRKKTKIGRELSFLLQQSSEEIRKQNLKKYFLDPNCTESLQDEIIRLNKELAMMKKSHEQMRKRLEVMCNKEGYITEGLKQEIKDDMFYSVQEASKITGILPRTLQRKAKKQGNRIIDNRYIFTGFQLKTLIENKQRKAFNIPKDNTKTYLIKNKRNGLYKIGRSKNPLKREKTLQSEEPDILMIKVWDGNIERDLHIKYKDYRIRGEWFKLSKSQVKYICTNYERSITPTKVN